MSNERFSADEGFTGRILDGRDHYLRRKIDQGNSVERSERVDREWQKPLDEEIRVTMDEYGSKE